MSEKQTFQTKLEKHQNSEATGIIIPFDVEKVFGAKRVPIKVSINEAKYRTTIFRRNGEYMMAVPKILRDAANIKSGEMITVTMEKDLAERTVDIPEDFAAELSKTNSKEAFNKLSFTHQKEYVQSIEESKRAETRRQRIEKAIEQLAAKK